MFRIPNAMYHIRNPRNAISTLRIMGFKRGPKKGAPKEISWKHFFLCIFNLYNCLLFTANLANSDFETPTHSKNGGFRDFF